MEYRELKFPSKGSNASDLSSPHLFPLSINLLFYLSSSLASEDGCIKFGFSKVSSVSSPSPTFRQNAILFEFCCWILVA
ncbi:hypothetical protein HPP92_012228 [Vanilla planifolia]|uniref:Uncharacterized protein n=1 Tax=Vanilla planifolia TaxID=51239 RepID=A0A835QX58_VANPL|nr:hypothetical protein HPP92_012228 [Vanilla planifolia]